MFPGFLMATINPGKKSGGRRRVKRARKSSPAQIRWRKIFAKRYGKKRGVVHRKRGSVSTLGRPKGRRRKVGGGSPMMYMANRRRRVGRSSRRTRARRRRNPLFRRRAGFGLGLGGKYSGKRSRGARRLRRLSHGWRNNAPVLPFSWNRPRRRKASKRRSRRNGYRRNGAVVPVSWNPRRGRRHRRGGYRSNPGIAGVLGESTRFLDVSFWTQTAIPASVGFGATKVGGAVIYGFVREPLKLDGVGFLDTLVQTGSQAISAGVLGWLAGNFLGRQIGRSVFIGGAVSATHTFLSGAFRVAGIAIPGFAGDELTDSLSQAVMARLRSSGMADYLNISDMRPMGDYANVPDISQNVGYDATPSTVGGGDDYS